MNFIDFKQNVTNYYGLLKETYKLIWFLLISKELPSIVMDLTLKKWTHMIHDALIEYT
jgi:hypothetical protein